MRNYLKALEGSGDTVHIDREVNSEHELAAVTYKIQMETGKAAVFHNVSGTRFKVATNLYGNRKRLCDLIGADDGNFCQKWNAVLSTPLTYPSMIEIPEEPDLVEVRMQDLPHITYCEGDVGPYITAGVFMALDPETKVPNLSFHRTMMIDDNEARIRLGPPHDLTQYQKVAEAKGDALEVAVLIGAPPEIFFGGCASIPKHESEIDVAARLRKSPVPMRRCRSIDMLVPAETEVVIEGRILPNIRKPEGPFGEFLWHYAPVGPNHVLEITRVVARKDAIFHSLLCGSPEDLMALEVAFASRVYSQLVRDIPGVIDVTCQPMLNCTIVKICKQNDGQVMQIMLKTFASHLQYNKVCIVVDEDIDISNFEQVWWAVMTRTRLNTGIMHLKDIPGFYHDHGIPGLHAGRLGIDATIPEGGKNFARKRIKGYETTDLKDYLRAE